MSEALAAVFPQTTLHTCIVHLIRHRLDFANWKERQPMATALRPIYTAVSAEAAGGRASTHLIPFFAFPPEVRRLVYPTNSLERVHAQLRKIIKTRGHFPNDDAATKLIWLALRNTPSTFSEAPAPSAKPPAPSRWYI